MSYKKSLAVMAILSGATMQFTPAIGSLITEKYNGVANCKETADGSIECPKIETQSMSIQETDDIIKADKGTGSGHLQGPACSSRTIPFDFL